MLPENFYKLLELEKMFPQVSLVKSQIFSKNSNNILKDFVSKGLMRQNCSCKLTYLNSGTLLKAYPGMNLIWLSARLSLIRFVRFLRENLWSLWMSHLVRDTSWRWIRFFEEKTSVPNAPDNLLPTISSIWKLTIYWQS